MDIYAYNPYGGDPRPELEESWDNLMRSMQSSASSVCLLGCRPLSLPFRLVSNSIFHHPTSSLRVLYKL